MYLNMCTTAGRFAYQCLQDHHPHPSAKRVNGFFPQWLSLWGTITNNNKEFWEAIHGSLSPDSCHIIMLVHETTLVGLISNDDKTARGGKEQLDPHCPPPSSHQRSLRGACLEHQVLGVHMCWWSCNCTSIMTRIAQTSPLSPPHPSCPPSTEESPRVFWPAPSLSDIRIVTTQTSSP